MPHITTKFNKYMIRIPDKNNLFATLLELIKSISLVGGQANVILDPTLAVIRAQLEFRIQVWAECGNIFLQAQSSSSPAGLSLTFNFYLIFVTNCHSDWSKILAVSYLGTYFHFSLISNSSIHLMTRPRNLTTQPADRPTNPTSEIVVFSLKLF